MSNYIATNLRSGVLISEERESIATRESALWKRETSVAILSRSSKKRTPDRRLYCYKNTVAMFFERVEDNLNAGVSKPERQQGVECRPLQSLVATILSLFDVHNFPKFFYY